MAKILTSRLKRVIHDMVECSQSALIEGRSITDNILFSHELFKGYTRKVMSPRYVLKVDLRKVYDTLDWHFLQAMLVDLGFLQRFVKWIMAYVTIVPYSLVINGGLTKPLRGKRSIRQGDPMSPYIFVLASNTCKGI